MIVFCEYVGQLGIDSTEGEKHLLVVIKIGQYDEKRIAKKTPSGVLKQLYL